MYRAAEAPERHTEPDSQVDPHALADFIQEAVTGKPPPARETHAAPQPSTPGNQENPRESQMFDPPGPPRVVTPPTQHACEGIGLAGGTGEAAAVGEKSVPLDTSGGLLLQQRPSEGEKDAKEDSTQVRSTSPVTKEAAAVAATATVTSLAAEMRCTAEALSQHGDAWTDKAARLAGQVRPLAYR
jgi:hypothetical protein